MPTHANGGSYALPLVIALAWLILLGVFLSRLRRTREFVRSAVVAIASYLIAAWLVSGCLLASAVVHRGADTGWWILFVAAPVAVPLQTFHDPTSLMFLWLLGVLASSFVIFRLLRHLWANRAQGL